MNKTNKRFGGWSSEGMKRYDEIAKIVKSDREHNEHVERQFKDYMMGKIYGDNTKAPKLVPVKEFSDIHDKLGKKYVPYNEFGMSKTLTKVNTKQTDVKNRYPDCVVSSTNNCEIKHTLTPTKHKKKHTITPTKHELPDPILSQPEVIQVHQQQVKTLAEMEQEIILKQYQKPITNIHEIYNIDKPKNSKDEVRKNEYYIL